MNYITHLTGFFQRVSGDFRLNPTHVSLYMALFQQWNLNRFRNPISIARAEVMGISKISSRVTYHKCIRELHGWGYIHYDPSYNHFRGSLVYMLGLEERQEPEEGNNRLIFRTGPVPELDGNCTGGEREVNPSINNTNSTNRQNGREAPAPSSGSENGLEGINNRLEDKARERKEKGCDEKEKKDAGLVPPGLEEVRVFFQGRGQPETEALKFFHHYRANGWRVGKVPMQDWLSSARKWILNSFTFPRYASHQRGDSGQSAQAPGATGKDYSEQL
jgi:hypothetical protein